MILKKPVMKNKVIRSAKTETFEKMMDEFLAPLNNYSIQFKPTDIFLCALITYQVEDTDNVAV